MSEGAATKTGGETEDEVITIKRSTYEEMVKALRKAQELLSRT